MRNITYLLLNERTVENRQDTLFLFIDSDQEFRLPGAGSAPLYGLNYFYHLDRIFSRTTAQVLTGKVVGDPPVSPAVMAVTFLDDVLGFLRAMQQHEPDADCSFHQTPTASASYHDMAQWFGLKVSSRHQTYTCTLQGSHDHRACFRDFARRLDHFFDGEHPTRSTWYEHQEIFSSLQPARTLYTGNYVLRSSALRYFIPFAHLRLRMAGPVLGRIMQAELGEAFVSANLPMLHKRTVEALGQSEYRPGIERAREHVDLSGEFERQFFGDIMLFGMEQLTAEGYPEQLPTPARISRILDHTHERLYKEYLQRQGQIQKQLQQLTQLFQEPAQWWHQPDMLEAYSAFQHFFENMWRNFGPDAPVYAVLADEAHCRSRKQAMLQALLAYPEERRAWSELLSA